MEKQPRPRGSEQEGEKEQKQQHCHRCNNNKAADSCAVHHCKTDWAAGIKGPRLYAAAEAESKGLVGR